MRRHADLMTAHADLLDFATMLRNGGKISAEKLNHAFAHASTELAKHHPFLAKKSADEGDMQKASQQLMAAVDHLREAAHSANLKYGMEIVSLYEHCSPNGYGDETIKMDK